MSYLSKRRMALMGMGGKEDDVLYSATNLDLKGVTIDTLVTPFADYDWELETQFTTPEGGSGTVGFITCVGNQGFQISRWLNAGVIFKAVNTNLCEWVNGNFGRTVIKVTMNRIGNIVSFRMQADSRDDISTFIVPAGYETSTIILGGSARVVMDYITIKKL